MNNKMDSKKPSCGIFKAFFHFWKYMFNYKKYTPRTEFWEAKAWEYTIVTVLLIIGLAFNKKTLQQFFMFCLFPKVSYAKRVLSTNPFIVGVLIILAVLYVPLLALRTRRLLDAGVKPAEAYLMVIMRPIFAILAYVGLISLFYDALWIACIVIELMPTGMEVIRRMQSQFQYYASYQPNYGPLSLTYRPHAKKNKYYIAPTYNYNNYYNPYRNNNNNNNNGYLNDGSNVNKPNNRLKK